MPGRALPDPYCTGAERLNEVCMLNYFSLDYLIEMLFIIPVLLIAFPVHECSHGLVAYWLGDPTAKSAGRLTLNPLRHLDPFGTICLILFRFGWAKPVPVNPNYFKNPREGMALTAIAGPLSNFILGFISALFYYKIPHFFPGVPGVILYFLQISAIININLSNINLIPIAPLDGPRILMFFLPRSAEAWLYRYERYLAIVIMLLLFTGILSGPLNFMVTRLWNNFSYLISLIPF